MDNITNYRNIIKQLVLHYAQLRPSHGDIYSEAVIDETRDRYALMQTGWDRGKHIRGNLLYVKLENGKVHIEYDGIGYGITDELVMSGIAEEDIVLAYLPDAPTLADYNRAEKQPKVRSWQSTYANSAAVHAGA
jgi:hypothetical protein